MVSRFKTIASQKLLFLFNQGAEQGNNRKEYNEHNCKVENQFLYTAPSFEYCSSAAPTENATQTCATRLKQDKHYYRYTENNLYYPDCR
jgi:hypothetical protein